MLKLRCQAVDRVVVRGEEGGGVQTRWCAQCDGDVGVGADCEGRFSGRVGGGGDGTSKERPFEHCFGEGLEQEWEVGELGEASGFGDCWWCGDWAECRGVDEWLVGSGRGGGEVVGGYVRVEHG